MAAPHPPARKRKMPERKKLNVGQFIASEKDAYKIESILGSGGFGDVYKVIVVKDESKKYAMKTEYFDPRKRKLLNRLKAWLLKSETEIEVEMGVFTEIQHMPVDRRKHFIQMVDKGQTDQFKFIVMEIVSHSLEDIRKYMLNGKLSWHTAIRVASQTLNAISDLHSVGYIHRDIKPHNFAIGRAPMQNNIYMLDFGIARRFTEKDGKIRVPRERVTFLGTVKFASRQCHLEQEQSRKDDLEVWIYMVLELFEQENLIWRRQTDRSQILQLKERLFSHTGIHELDLRMPTGFKKIMEYVKRLAFADEPDYQHLDRILTECARTDKIDTKQPLDWIDKTMPEKNKVKKKASHARLENDDDSADRRRRQRLMEKAKKEKEKASEGKEESEDDDDEDDEDKDKKESQGGSEGTGKNKAPRKSLSRTANKNKKSRDTKEQEGGRPLEKRADAGASKMQKLSKKQATSDTQVSHQGHVKSPQRPSPKRPSPKRHSERRKKSARRAKSRPRSSKQKRKTSDVERGGKPKVSIRGKSTPPPPPPMAGPPLKNVSVMIMPEGPADANYVKSGYIALDMGPAGKKARI